MTDAQNYDNVLNAARASVLLASVMGAVSGESPDDVLSTLATAYAGTLYQFAETVHYAPQLGQVAITVKEDQREEAEAFAEALYEVFGQEPVDFAVNLALELLLPMQRFGSVSTALYDAATGEPIG